MLVKLARYITTVVQACAMLAAPVLASMPKCCAKTSSAGERACCCCGQHGAMDEPDDCDATEKPCCAKRRAARATPPTKSDCGCKTRRSVPATAEEMSRYELRSKQFAVVGNTIALTILFPHESHLTTNYSPVNSPPGPPLRTVLCRWQV
jgi:hypothetical protein